MSGHRAPFTSRAAVAAAGLIAAALTAPGIAKPDKDKHENGPGGRAAYIQQAPRASAISGQVQTGVRPPAGGQWEGRTFGGSSGGHQVREPSGHAYRPAMNAGSERVWQPENSGVWRRHDPVQAAPRRDSTFRPVLFGHRQEPVREAPRGITRPATAEPRMFGEANRARGTASAREERRGFFQQSSRPQERTSPGRIAPERVTSRWAESLRGRIRDENVRTAPQRDTTFRPVLFGQRPVSEPSKQTTRPARSERGIFGETNRGLRMASTPEEQRGFLQKPAKPRENASPGRVEKEDRQVGRPQGLTSGGALTKNIRSERVTSRWAESLRERIRDENVRAAREGKAVPPKQGFFERTRGKFTPVVVERSSHPAVAAHFTRIKHRHGTPSFGFSIIPRPTSAFSPAVSSGGTSFFLGVHYGVPTTFVSRRVVFLSYYYPWYFDDPFYTGFWYPGWYPSIYTYYGWVPRWSRPPSLVVYDYDPYPIYVARTPYYYLDRPRLDVVGVERAMSDIREAWLDSDADSLGRYLHDGKKISVYFDGKYAYSLSADDYYRMTLDAMSTIRTQDLDFDDPTWINSSEVRFTGRHIFYNMDNQRETVYVVYRLHRYGGDWYIIAVDSSPKPLRNGYRGSGYRY